MIHNIFQNSFNLHCVFYFCLLIILLVFPTFFTVNVDINKIKENMNSYIESDPDINLEIIKKIIKNEKIKKEAEHRLAEETKKMLGSPGRFEEGISEEELNELQNTDNIEEGEEEYILGGGGFTEL